MKFDLELTKVCGFNISRGGVSDHVSFVQSLCANNIGAWIVTLNTEMLSYVFSDLDYRLILESADIFVADGMPIVWAANIKSPDRKISDRTTGVDLVENILKLQEVPAFAIIGGKNTDTVVKNYPYAEKQCKYIFSGIVDLSEEQIEELINELVASNISLLLIALGVPKQDQLAHIIRKRLPEIVIIGIGGTFDMLSLIGKRAPMWMQKSGLEWFFRLCTDPARLWRRYVLVYPKGILFLVRDCIQKN